MDIKLAIFDFDGTIMDTREAIIVAKQETMRQMGLKIVDEKACAATIGMTSKIGFKTTHPDLTDEMLDLCVINYRKNFDRIKEEIPPVLFPNVVETLNKITEKGIECTIATSRNRKSLIEFLDKMNIRNFFSYVLAAEDTKLLKPNAEPVLKTMNDLSYKAENTLVIGDMPIDILMGKNASVYTCGVTYGNSDRNSLQNAGADCIIDGISELLEFV